MKKYSTRKATNNMSYNYDLNPYDELVNLRLCIDELYKQIDNLKKDNLVLDDKLNQIYDELSMDNKMGDVDSLPRCNESDRLAVQRQAEQDFPIFKRRNGRLKRLIDNIKRDLGPKNS